MRSRKKVTIFSGDQLIVTKNLIVTTPFEALSLLMADIVTDLRKEGYTVRPHFWGYRKVNRVKSDENLIVFTAGNPNLVALNYFHPKGNRLFITIGDYPHSDHRMPKALIYHYAQPKDKNEGLIFGPLKYNSAFTKCGLKLTTQESRIPECKLAYCSTLEQLFLAAKCNTIPIFSRFLDYEFNYHRESDLVLQPFSKGALTDSIRLLIKGDYGLLKLKAVKKEIENNNPSKTMIVTKTIHAIKQFVNDPHGKRVITDNYSNLFGG